MLESLISDLVPRLERVGFKERSPIGVELMHVLYEANYAAALFISVGDAVDAMTIEGTVLDAENALEEYVGEETLLDLYLILVSAQAPLDDVLDSVERSETVCRKHWCFPASSGTSLVDWRIDRLTFIAVDQLGAADVMDMDFQLSDDQAQLLENLAEGSPKALAEARLASYGTGAQ